MNNRAAELADRAEELRQAFDRGFSEAPSSASAAPIDLLAVRVGNFHCALRLSEIKGLFADKTITPVPTRVPTLIGIASFRRAIVPVYDLSLLLFGQPAAPGARWVAIASGANIALAFDDMAGHFRAGVDEIARDPGSSARLHISEFVRIRDEVYGVVDLSSVAAMVIKNASLSGRKKE